MEEPCGSKNDGEKPKTLPICLIVLGMAGSGKTTFVNQIVKFLHSKTQPPYVVNLDPACYEVAYPCNVDIRDTIKYKDVMKQYGLGPNGAIVTSLNLFSTKFGQLIKLLENSQEQYKYVVFDTPGQIEVFTWSASGNIITESLASSFPTVIVYIMDTVRNANPVTFMSNMLYSCSILYKTKLPFIIVMNKIDVIDHSFAVEWMTDFESFNASLESEQTYISNFTRSVSLYLDEFYKDLNYVGVSSLTGVGVDEFFTRIQNCAAEYESDYKPQLEKIKAERDVEETKAKEEALQKIKSDGGIGTSVPLITEVPSGREMSDIYLKHPANESSDDSEGEEDDTRNTGNRAGKDIDEDEIGFREYIKKEANKREQKYNEQKQET